jgi:hypothetical protein
MHLSSSSTSLLLPVFVPPFMAVHGRKRAVASPSGWISSPLRKLRSGSKKRNLFLEVLVQQERNGKSAMMLMKTVRLLQLFKKLAVLPTLIFGDPWNRPLRDLNPSSLRHREVSKELLLAHVRSKSEINAMHHQSRPIRKPSTPFLSLQLVNPCFTGSPSPKNWPTRDSMRLKTQRQRSIVRPAMATMPSTAILLTMAPNLLIVVQRYFLASGLHVVSEDLEEARMLLSEATAVVATEVGNIEEAVAAVEYTTAIAAVEEVVIEEVRGMIGVVGVIHERIGAMTGVIKLSSERRTLVSCIGGVTIDDFRKIHGNALHGLRALKRTGLYDYDVRRKGVIPTNSSSATN